VKKKIEEIESYDSFYQNGDIDKVLKEAKEEYYENICNAASSGTDMF